MCAIHRLGDKDKELSAADMLRAADILADLGLARVVITGGEPLLRPDWIDLVDRLAGRGLSVTLLTNGLLLKRNDLERAYQAGLEDIGISIDTLEPELMDQITGGKEVLPRILAGFETALSCRTRGLIQALITVTPLNLSEIPALVRFFDQMGVSSVVNPVNVPAESGPALLAASDDQLSPAALPVEEVDRVYHLLREMKSRGSGLLISDRFLRDSAEYLKTGHYRWNCHAGRSYFTVFSGGGFSICSDMEPLANIMEPGFPERYRSADFRERMKRDRRACAGCIYSCWRELSYLITDPRVMGERLGQALSGLV
jgi:MoaA/NifB/PqqE/SkfB family radical SAM enzyme